MEIKAQNSTVQATKRACPSVCAANDEYLHSWWKNNTRLAYESIILMGTDFLPRGWTCGTGVNTDWKIVRMFAFGLLNAIYPADSSWSRFFNPNNQDFLNKKKDEEKKSNCNLLLAYFHSINVPSNWFAEIIINNTALRECKHLDVKPSFTVGHKESWFTCNERIIWKNVAELMKCGERASSYVRVSAAVAKLLDRLGALSYTNIRSKLKRCAHIHIRFNAIPEKLGIK